MTAPSTDTEIRAAAGVLRRGGLVAFPTETVYGLGSDARNQVALRRLFEVKGRPPDHPVIVHLAVGVPLDEWVQSVPPTAAVLAEQFWPGPLTLVLNRSPLVPDEVTGGRASVGVRVPGQPMAQALLRAFGGGIAAPSANRYGRVSPTTAADVRADFGDDVDVVLDGGPCRVGVESTIVDCRGEVAILRLGGVTREAVEAAVGQRVAIRDAGEVAAPGTRPGHYSPSARVHVVTAAQAVDRAWELLAVGHRVGLLAPGPPRSLPAGLVVLVAPRESTDYARVLYSRLREADRLGLDDLVVVPPPAGGIGDAVADRLRRAAAGRTESEP